MSGDAFAEFERAGWERAAPRYEEYWTDTVLFVEPLLDAAGVGAGSRLLDVACGPGFVSEAAAARGAHPVGVDIATAMVERARMRCPDLTFVVGDALRLPFPDASFDAITMNFGILHVSQPERALAEVHRVLVPGGRLAFTTWVAEGNAEDEITEAALAAHAIAAEGAEGPSYHVFADPDECRRALAGCGFDTGSLRMDTVTALWRVPSEDFLFQAQLHAGVRTAAVLRAQPPDRLEAIRTTMADAVRGYADGDAFALPIAARLISARASDRRSRPRMPVARRAAAAGQLLAPSVEIVLDHRGAARERLGADEPRSDQLAKRSPPHGFSARCRPNAPAHEPHSWMSSCPTLRGRYPWCGEEPWTCSKSQRPSRFSQTMLIR